MQVRSTTQANSKKTSRKRGDKSSTRVSSNDSPSDFTRLLDEVLPPQNNRTMDLNELWSGLPTVEKQLLEHPSIDNLEKYKELVFNIAKSILKTNVKVKKLKRKKSNGEMIELTLLEFVDTKLKKMAEIVFNPSLPAFHLLKTTQDIRGVLLDYRQ